MSTQLKSHGILSLGDYTCVMGERSEKSKTLNINPIYMYNEDLVFAHSVNKNVCTNNTI